MDHEEIRKSLPVFPSQEYRAWAHHECCDLIPHFLLHHAERINLFRPLAPIMTAQDREPIGSAWVEHCTCTQCGESFEAAHVPGGFSMYSGPDGCLYEVDPGGEVMMPVDVDDYGIDGQYLELSDNDGIACPLCGSHITVIHTRKLRGGRTRQLLAAEVRNIGKYTAVICWLNAVHIFDDGSYDIEIYPRDAYVIDDYGRIVRYRRTRGTSSYATECTLDEWVEAYSRRDSFTVPYHDWLSYNNKKVGGVIYPICPNLVGCTGEKTGIKAYVEAGGGNPVTYLYMWNKYRSVENLANSGWIRLIDEAVERHALSDARNLCDDIPGADFKKSKPHEILRMARADFRLISKHAKWGWEKFSAWVKYLEVGGRCPALDFEKYYKSFGRSGFHLATRLVEKYPGHDLPKLAAYLDKQHIAFPEVGLLADSRRMAQDLHPDTPLSMEELWPRHLQDAHDRLSGAWLLQQDKQKSRSLDEGFAKIIDIYGHLQWSDGDLRILLPQTNDDLVREGSVLRHCVGTYGNGHVEGRSVIFFVRKHRRPERCYYTLDICFTAGIPNEVQLHGYGNERHGVNKEYSHKIPYKVRQFVDRWKTEVLIPWYLSTQKGA